MQKLLICLLATGLFMAACKKTEVPTGFNDPVFKVFFSTDTLTDSLTAGLDGVYLFTHYTLNNEVFHSINSFSDVNCPDGDCPGSLSFEFRGNANVDSAFIGSYYIGTTLYPGIYPYSLPDSLASGPAGFNVQFNWGDLFSNFDQMATFQVANHTLTTTNGGSGGFNTILFDDQPQLLTLESFGENGLHSFIQRWILPSNPSFFPSIGIKATPAGSNAYTLTAFSDWTGPVITKYLWNNGDTDNTTQTDSVLNLHHYAVTATDDFGNTAVASLDTLPYPATTEIRNSFVTFQSAPFYNTDQIGTVAIQWVDPSGTIWRSDRNVQPGSFSHFEIINSEVYEPNEHGDRVRKLQVEFSCLLYHPSGFSKEFTGNGIIAMARN